MKIFNPKLKKKSKSKAKKNKQNSYLEGKPKVKSIETDFIQKKSEIPKMFQSNEKLNHKV
jgi:hypothetical protein